MIYTGCHLSSAKGFEAMGKNALKLGADTFAFSPGIPGVEMQRPSIPQMRPGFGNWRRSIILERLLPTRPIH